MHVVTGGAGFIGSDGRRFRPRIGARFGAVGNRINDIPPRRGRKRSCTAFCFVATGTYKLLVGSMATTKSISRDLWLISRDLLRLWTGIGCQSSHFSLQFPVSPPVLASALPETNQSESTQLLRARRSTSAD